jgi:hypothetical protein
MPTLKIRRLELARFSGMKQLWQRLPVASTVDAAPPRHLENVGHDVCIIAHYQQAEMHEEPNPSLRRNPQTHQVGPRRAPFTDGIRWMGGLAAA